MKLLIVVAAIATCVFTWVCTVLVIDEITATERHHK